MTRRRPGAPPARPARAIPVTLAITVLLAALTGGCASPGWYAQAVTGHTRLMRTREPVADYLERAEPGDPLAAALATADELLSYAEQSLDLERGDAYRTLARVDGEAVTWNVVATPPYRLDPQRWCFLVAGCVPYRGYFDRTDADRFADRLKRSGHDVAVSPAAAYSTLGWYEDPILDTMLDASDAELADTLFHELAHRTLYVKGSSTFNESYATFVAREGVRSWLTMAGRADEFSDWADRQSMRDDFLALLAQTRSELARLYDAETSVAALEAGKQDTFARLRQDYDLRVVNSWSGRDPFRGWFDPPPNNADLALVATYTGGLCAFEVLWREAERDFRRFHKLARAASELPARDRARWLATPCPDGPAGAR